MGNKKLPDIKINPIEDLIENNLDLKAANGLSIPNEGFIEVRFRLPNSQPRKCNLFRREVQCLDRVVSEYGYRMDPTKIQAVLSLKNKQPKTVGEVRHLLGLLGYYRRYIQDFSRVAKPLFNLLQRSNASSNGKSKTVPSSQTISWTDESPRVRTPYHRSSFSISRLQRALRVTYGRIRKDSVQYYIKSKI